MNHFFRCLLPAMMLASAVVFSACSKDEDKDGTAKEVAATGTIAFSLPSSVTATVAHPAVVTQGQPLDMEISQKSSYTDPNGSVYTCEPKASIKLDVKQDTLYAKDLQTLISITESSDVSESGTNPRQYKTLQKFNVGGQEVVFDLAHEIYTYVNSRQTSIEMPYIKVNSAKYGAATPKETRSSTPASVSGIRLKPLGAVTRGLTVTTSQAYEINVSFNLELEGVNTKDAATQTLSFEANYVGIVETSTVLPSPATSFSYKLEVLDGTSNTSSPFTLQKGKTLSLQWDEDSRYSYFSPETLEEKTVPFAPKAWVKLAASEDTIWTDKKETLEKVTNSEPIVTTEGENPVATTGKWVCDIGGQTLTLDYGYEAYADVTVQDTTLVMPHLKLELPEIKSVTLKYLDGVTIPDVEGEVYEITARITQELKTVNVANPSSETLEYVVKYIGVEKVKLVKVTYRKQVEWEFCEDEWIFWPIVFRDRTYSNGVTMTDTFADYGHLCWYAVGCQPYPFEESGVVEYDGGKIIYSPQVVTAGLGNEGCDTILVVTRRIGVVDLKKIRPLEIGDAYYNTGTVKDWNIYSSSKSYEEMGLDVPLKDVTVYGADSVSTQPSGWYYHLHKYHRSLGVIYEEPNVPFLFVTTIEAAFHDQYLVIDGKMIWFIDEAFGEYHYDWKEEDIVEEDGGPAKVYTFSGWNVFYGMKFSATDIVTVYQLKPDQQSPSATRTAASTKESRILSPLQSAQPVARQKTIAPKGQYRYGFISGGDIHGNGKGPRPFTSKDDLRNIIKRQDIKVEIK